jgi:hypothetical protein
MVQYQMEKRFIGHQGCDLFDYWWHLEFLHS